MLVPFQFKELDTVQPLPPIEERVDVFEALPTSKAQRSAWQSMDFQPLNLRGEEAPLPHAQEPSEEPLQAPTEPVPQSGFEVHQPAPIIDKARLEALEQEAKERGYGAGYSAGHEAGLAAGKESGSAQAESALKHLLALQEGLKNVEGDFFRAIKADLVKLLQIGPRRIIGKELSLNPKAVVNMAEGLLSAFASQRSLTLRVNPEDAKLLEESGITSAKEEGAGLTILPDPNLNRADLHLITESGEIDASIETQLARYDKQVEAWISGDHDEDPKADEGPQ